MVETLSNLLSLFELLKVVLIERAKEKASALYFMSKDPVTGNSKSALNLTFQDS
jgi:hypothetical protein